MAFPATTPTLSVAATALLGNNAGSAGLSNSNNFDRLTYVEAILANLLTDVPVASTLLISGNIKTTGGSILTSSSGGGTGGGIGYVTGAGSSTTQITSKATAFTCNTVTGQITFNNAALAGWVTVSAIFNNSALTSTDMMILNHVSGGTVGGYAYGASNFSTSSCNVWLTNNSTASLSEAVVLKYAILRASVS